MEGSAKVHYSNPMASEILGSSIARALRNCGLSGRAPKPLVVVCVGTDRSTGDALGPLVGEKLLRMSSRFLTVYGTLDNPVHAANLPESIRMLDSNHRLSESVIVAIDACLGRSENVGFIDVRPGPLKPGTGVNKKLPSIGDLHIIGIVNVGGFMEYFVLQNTRLSLVMRMADTIADGFGLALNLIYNDYRSRSGQMGNGYMEVSSLSSETAAGGGSEVFLETRRISEQASSNET